MRVLYFGFYDPDYARNRILIKGLKANNIEVLECRDDSHGLKKFFRLYKKHRAFKGKYDAMVVGFLGHAAMPLAKMVSSGPIIFDAFISLYESNVFDRRSVRPKSVKAFYYWFLDWLSMKLADVILFDTQEQIKYASREFKADKGKFRRIFVGTDDSVFHPREVMDANRSDGLFTVYFHGSFIPLQGVDCIVKAAKLLEGEKIRFIVLGDGQTYPETKKLADELKLESLDFISRVGYDKLPDHINKADICLGIFGRTPKAGKVIPNKVYECAAMKKPIVTADTPAIRELFDDEDMVLIEPSPEKLASAILKLRDDPVLRNSISDKAYDKVKSLANPEILGRELKDIVLKLI